MNNKKMIVILILAFVLVVGGASVLYGRLGDRMAPDQLAVVTTQPTVITQVTDKPTTVPDETESQQTPPQTETPAETQETDPPYTQAPDFVVYDAEGREVLLSEFIGKPIVLNFWASWCGPCQMEMPDFNEKYLELGGEVQFLMINMTDGNRETVQIASEFVAERGYSFPVLFDTTGYAATVYGAYSLPTTFFINAEGHVIARAVGAIDRDTLQRGIDMIFP